MEHENYKIRVFRYDRESDERPRFDQFILPKEDNMTVLRGLQYIYENMDGSLSFIRYSCNKKRCTLCMLKINGVKRLACRVLLEDDMTIEPLEDYPLIKDLAVDFSFQRQNNKE